MANRGNVSQFDKNDPDTLVGVIARSAGVWDSKCFSYPSPGLEVYFLGWNRADQSSPADDKTVCSCSGKTVWQEREEQRDRGML
jgi:copper chaperone for superoxide dismutase